MTRAKAKATWFAAYRRGQEREELRLANLRFSMMYQPGDGARAMYLTLRWMARRLWLTLLWVLFLRKDNR